MEHGFQMHIERPCHENWDAMAPEKNGRFCGSCTKTVIDFTQLTDAEVLSTFLNAGGNCCGRFASMQLDRPLGVHSTQRIPFKMPAFAAAAFTSLLLLQALPEAHAQQGNVPKVLVCQAKDTPVTAGIQQMGVQHEQYLLGKPAPYRVLTGMVVDEKGKPLSGIHIGVRDQRASGYSDRYGRFHLQLPLTVTMDQPLSLYLMDIHNGFQSMEITLRHAGDDLKIHYQPSHAGID